MTPAVLVELRHARYFCAVADETALRARRHAAVRCRVRFTDAGRVMGVSYQSRQQYVLELSSTGR